MTKKLKDIIKMNPEPAKGKVGVDPMDPWAAKANLGEASLHQFLMSRGINPNFVSKDTKISHAKSSAFLKWKQDHKFEEVEHSLTEDAMLDKFLMSRGINPKYVTKDMKISHSKSGQFLKWKRDHMTEEVDKADTLTFDIPLMIRMLELAREDVKDDMELHRITERLIEIRNKGTLTMDDYDFIAGIKKLKEEIEAMAEGRMKDQVINKQEDDRLNKMTTLQKFRAGAAAREKKHSDIEKNSGGMTSAIDRLEKHLNKEEVVAEMDKSQTPPGRGAESSGDPYAKGKTVKPLSAEKTKKSLLNVLNKSFKKTYKEDTFQDPQAATQTVFDGGNNTNDTCTRKSQMSKSARIIKSLYKRKGVVKEDMYDHEKEDKSIQTYGKKPKVDEPDEKKNLGEKKPDARIVMSGGTTLTGEKRDTVEIDPLMKNRPGPDTFGASGKKASQQ